MSAGLQPAMTSPAAPPLGRTAAVYGFGSFRLLPAQRLLLEGESPVQLGSRAFDLLVALVERAGQVLGKQELLAAAWPGRIVEDNTLRVHIAALRRTLKRARCGADSERDGDCIVNVPGRGYCLVAPVWRITGPESIEDMIGRAGLALRGRAANGPAAAPPPPEPTPEPPPTDASTSVETMLEALQHQFSQAFVRGEHDLMLKASEQLSALARDTARPRSARVADRMRAQSYHFMGRHREAAVLARNLLASTVAREEAADARSDAPSPEVALGIVLARQDWLEGRPSQAQAGMAETLMRAAREHPRALGEALALGALPLALWRGDMLQAGQCLARLAELTRDPGYGQRFKPWVECLELLLERSLEGFNRLASLHKSLGAEQAKLADHLVSFDSRLVGETTLQRVLKCETGWCAPEILRARAEQLVKAQQPLRALRLLDDSLALARAQGSLAWELRSAISRAQLRAPHSLHELATIMRRFAAGESGADADQRAAQRLLESQSVPN